MERFKKWRDSLTWKQTVIMEQIMVISIYIIIRLIFFAIGVKFSSFKDAITYELLLFVLVYAVMYALISKVYGTSSKLEKESQKKRIKKLEKISSLMKMSTRKLSVALMDIIGKAYQQKWTLLQSRN